MAGLKNKIGLSIDSSSKIHKKYLGEADDPHFIPDSPLIERQVLSEQEEGELKRICALALAHVPHSDDMTEDPFKYLAPQIQSNPPHEPPAAENANSKNIPAPLPEVPPIPVGADTATPSDGSKRDTMDRTDYSTPLTSAGITPGEPVKRFSDAGKRASSSKGSSNLKYETAQRNKSRATSASHSMPRKSNDAGIRKSHDVCKPSGDHRAGERPVRAAQDIPRQSEALTRSTEIARPGRYSQLELNKKLPPLPRPEIEPSRQAPIDRIMKTIKKKKSQVIEGRSASLSASSTPLLPTTMPDAAKPRQKSMPIVQPPATAFHTPTEPKRRLRLRFFGGRKDRPQQDVMVS